MRRKKNFKRNAAQTLLRLAGSWEDSRSADAIIKDLKKSRRNSKPVNLD